jgi:hypothetical protein
VGQSKGLTLGQFATFGSGFLPGPTLGLLYHLFNLSVELRIDLQRLPLGIAEDARERSLSMTSATSLETLRQY